MHVVAITTYPLKSVMEVGKRFVESLKDPLPDYVNRLAIYTRYGGKGIQVYSPVEIEKGREDEGLKELVKWYVPFFDIEGFEVKIEFVLIAEESLPLIGLEMP